MLILHRSYPEEFPLLAISPVLSEYYAASRAWRCARIHRRKHRLCCCAMMARPSPASTCSEHSTYAHSVRPRPLLGNDDSDHILHTDRRNHRGPFATLQHSSKSSLSIRSATSSPTGDMVRRSDSAQNSRIMLKNFKSLGICGRDRHRDHICPAVRLCDSNASQNKQVSRMSDRTSTCRVATASTTTRISM